MALIGFGASTTIATGQPLLCTIAVANKHDQMNIAAPVAALAHAACDLGNMLGPILGGVSFFALGLPYTAFWMGVITFVVGAASAPLLVEY